MFLYTLELEGNLFYVGTTNSPPARLVEHREGRGAEWTRQHPPICFSKVYKLRKLDCEDSAARLQEDAQVKMIMLAKGIHAVRGGSYSRPDLTRDDIKALCKELYHANNGCSRKADIKVIGPGTAMRKRTWLAIALTMTTRHPHRLD